MTTNRLCALFALVLAACLGASRANAEGGPTEPHHLLEAAFDRRYQCSLTAVIEIETRKGDTAALKRRLDVATKSIASRLHTYAIFREPQFVRGVAFLSIEGDASRESEERFVYLPSMRKIRRVSGSQSEDAFLGTDLSYHDFQRQRGEDYRVALAGTTSVAGEPAWVITAHPQRSASYAAVEHLIAEKDLAILGTRYFKQDASHPYKQLWMDRARIAEHGGCRVPTRIRVSDEQRGTDTVLTVSALRLGAKLSDDLFSMVALETRRPIPGL